MDRDKLDPTPPAASISELKALSESGASPDELLRAAGVPPEDVPETVASIERWAAVMDPRAPWAADVAHHAPEQVSAELDRMEEDGRQLEGLDAHLRSGKLAADWGIIMLPLDFSERDRFDALRRILDRMDGDPIHPAKWRDNRDAFMAALEDMGVSRKQLAETRGWEAVREAVGHLTPQETREETPEIVRSFRSALERLIAEDLLGPEWRKKTVQEAVPLDSASLGPVEDEMFAAIEARMVVDALLEGAGLTDGERDVLELARDGYKNREIAERTGRTYDAVRTARSGGMRKILDTLP